MVTKYLVFLEKLFLDLRFEPAMAKNISQGIGIITLFVISFILFFLMKYFLVKFVGKWIKKTKTVYDDFFLNRKLERRIAFLIPIYLIKNLLYDFAPDLDTINSFIIVWTRVGEVTTYTGILLSIIDSLSDIYSSFDVSKHKPIKGLIQIIRIILIIICVLLIIAVLTNKNLSNIFIGLGTLSAVLMLVFKDPILGFVGGIQLTSNDMIRIGDWIVKGNADGVVTDMGLTTVKVQNWDNTISTVPTYSLISEPFINWRGMAESGGRRIARAFIIDVDTVKFCTPEMLEKYKKFQLVEKYIVKKENEIAEYNKQNNIDTSNLVNGRRQTNLGIFRAYLTEYLKKNPNINHDMTLMVRQKPATEFGIPMEVYCFSKIKTLAEYESIQGDIFDHIYAVIKQFDLKMFQRPSSHSISLMSDK
ncbi:MAG: mechanosensitive ion channel [Bacteroidales bacterium]|nr:mechanosensitive ion channel [Bacteroidales bacterium]